MKLKTCPSCGSANITLEIGGVAGVIYRCKTCNYRGSLVVERDIDKQAKD